MRAFVLSGGGNYGALQAGALEVLLAHGVEPDMLVSVSAGALNAAWLAAHPTRAGARRLAQIWRDSAPQFFSPPSRAGMLLRLARGMDSLLPNAPLQRFIQTWAPAGSTFGDFAQPRLYVVAACLADRTLRVFGDDPAELLFDGLMASTALPPLYSPWPVDGVAYVDGGAVSDLPLLAAITRGADEIFALHISYPSRPALLVNAGQALRKGNSNGASLRGILTIGGQAIGTLVDRNTELEIEVVRNRRNVRLHLIRLWPEADPGFWDFTHAEALIADGRRATERYLVARPAVRLWRAGQNHWLHRLATRRRPGLTPTLNANQGV